MTGWKEVIKMETSKVPKIGQIVTEAFVDINYPQIKNNSLKLVPTGQVDKNGYMIYRVALK